MMVKLPYGAQVRMAMWKLSTRCYSARKVNANLTRHTDRRTGLDVATGYGHVDVVLALLQHDKVDVNLQNKYGSAALFRASSHGHLEVVRALLWREKVEVNYNVILMGEQPSTLQIVMAIWTLLGVS
jgi:predicted LPLAT superfamily acyltransferase